MKTRATVQRGFGRRVDKTATPAEIAYAYQLRRSAGWTPKHRADDTEGASR